MSDWQKRLFCSHSCFSTYSRGASSPHWKGGIRHGHDWGYLRCSDGKYLHRLVMEEYLGRRLSMHEHVHHLNGDVTDNRPENMEILTNSEHRKLHAVQQKRNKKGQFSCEP